MASKRKCCFCKEYFPKESMLTANNKIVFCCLEHMAKYGLKNKDKGRKTMHREQKKRFKDNDKSYRTKCAQQAFNAFIRYNDRSDPCISCGRYHSGQYHAGHYRSTGAHPELRFEELNCHKQCAPCNNHLSGNIADYRINLIKKIGIDKVEWLEGPHEHKKYTCEELKEIETYYKQKLKELQNE